MMPQSWIGQTIGGRYQIETLLGQGGMSAVYRGVDPNLRRVIAIKLIHPHLSVNPDFVERFKEEAAAVAGLRHPNIVQVHDFNNDGPTYYMVMEYLAGETLQARLKRLTTAHRQFSLEEALRFSRQICEAAGYAHRRGLVHRDIKPANVMLDLHGQAILMDFGIVKIVGGQYHTATGATIGTAMYMSPEQIRSEVVDERCDIYALGVMLFEMLSGRPPYEADSTLTVMMMHLNDPLPDLRDLRPDVPPAVLGILNKALAKERENRYQTAAEMAAALKRVQESLDSETLAAGLTAQTVEPAPPEMVITPAVIPVEEATLKAAAVRLASPSPSATPQATPADLALAAATLPAQTKVPQAPVPEDTARRIPPGEPEIEAQVAPTRKISRKATFAGVAVVVLILLATAGFFLYSSRKLPAIELSPIAPPVAVIAAENLSAVVNLVSWQVDSAIIELAFSPDGALLATAHDRDWVRFSQYKHYGALWQVEPGALQDYLLDHEAWLNGIAFSPDGALVATVAEDNRTNLWQVSDGSLLRTLDSPNGGVTSVDFSPNGKLMATSTWDGSVDLWQVSNGSLLRTLKDADISLREVEFSPDSSLLAAAAEDGAVRVWSVSNGSLRYTLQGHESKVFGINFSPDGSLLASASEDTTIAIWQVSDGSLLHKLEGHTAEVSDVAFSPDGLLLASGSADYTLRLWQVSDGSPLAELTGSNDTVLALSFSPDGGWLVSAGGDQAIRFWGVSEALSGAP